MQRLVNTLVGIAVKTIQDTFSDQSRNVSQDAGEIRIGTVHANRVLQGAMYLNFGRNSE